MYWDAFCGMKELKWTSSIDRRGTGSHNEQKVKLKNSVQVFGEPCKIVGDRSGNWTIATVSWLGWYVNIGVFGSHPTKHSYVIPPNFDRVISILTWQEQYFFFYFLNKFKRKWSNFVFKCVQSVARRRKRLAPSVVVFPGHNSNYFL